jgi:transketolase
MSIDDVNLMRAIPNIVIAEPIDEASMMSLLPQILKHNGITYMRLFRKPAQKVYDEGYKLTLGKASTLIDGKDIAIIASGIMTHNALMAADILKISGISASVIDMHTIKPLDKKAVLNVARRCGAVVTVENHSIIGGLGSAVAEVLAEDGCPAKLTRVGFQDRYGLVGFRPYLEETIGLTPEHIAKAARSLL